MLYNKKDQTKQEVTRKWLRLISKTFFKGTEKKVTLDLSGHQPDRSNCRNYRMYRQCGIHPVQYCGEENGTGTGAETDRQPYR